MYYILMHKDTKVALCKDNRTILVYSEKHLPMGCPKVEKQYDLSLWLDTRRIPENRLNAHKLQEELNKIGIPYCDKMYNYGLSLTDNYWSYSVSSGFVAWCIKHKLKKVDKKLPKYKEINLFDCEKEESVFQVIINGGEVELPSTPIPDFTTGGKTQKYWATRNKRKFLVKQNDAVESLTAEKEMLALMLAYVLNECRTEAKKKPIAVSGGKFEKGKKHHQNCFYTEIFTSTETDIVPYNLLIANKEEKPKSQKLKEFLKEYGKHFTNLNEYFEFVMILDFIMENQREEDDIGFLRDAEFLNLKQVAPLYGNGKGFGYLGKDFTRANKKPYNSGYMNIFGMNEEEQCKYIAENAKWFMPEIMYKKSELFIEYLGCDDMDALTRQQRDNIADWVKYKIVLIADERRRMAMAEMIASENGDGEYDDYDEEDELYDDDMP